MYSFTSAQLAILSAALLGSANAHMLMKNPVPYGAPNNSPLEPSGSDFPCKAVAYDVVTMNDWAAGSTQTLSFTGSAVHGGGSCQIVVTTDKAPTKDSKFKVIHSIEGGCPASAEGNLGSDGQTPTFDFTVPTDLPNGEMTMAWTWFNKIGNREMYMNCAPISVSGGADDTSAFDSLPDMATANIGGGSCTTPANSDFTFANPGKSTVRNGSGPFSDLCGGAASEGGSSGGAPSDGSSPAPAPADPPASSPAPADPPASNPAPADPPASSPSPAPQAPTTGGGSGSCTQGGAIVCNGSDQFGICVGGAATWQAVAAGTTCSNGAIQKRGLAYIHRAQRAAIP